MKRAGACGQVVYLSGLVIKRLFFSSALFSFFFFSGAGGGVTVRAPMVRAENRRSNPSCCCHFERGDNNGKVFDDGSFVRLTLSPQLWVLYDTD